MKAVSKYYKLYIVICKHSDKYTFYTLRFDCSFAATNTIKPQLLLLLSDKIY